MHAHYIVKLTSHERETLECLISGGTKQARKVKRAQVLLATDRGVSDVEIAAAINCGTATIYRVKKAFVEEGLEQALNEKPRPGAKRKLSGRDETLLVALACSTPPLGRARWTLQLLADEYQRNGVANIFMMVGAAFPWRQIKVTARRTAIDFAEVMRDLVDVHFPDAERFVS